MVDFIPDVRADCNGEKLLKLVNRSQRDHRNKSGLILIGSQGTFARPALDCVPSVLLVRWSSGLLAWNDMPAHLHNLDLTLSGFRQLLKTALFQTVPV